MDDPIETGRWLLKVTDALNDDIANSHPSISRGKVWCKNCGIEKDVNPAQSIRSGWPTCCGQTMTIDHPDTWPCQCGKDRVPAYEPCCSMKCWDERFVLPQVESEEREEPLTCSNCETDDWRTLSNGLCEVCFKNHMKQYHN